MCIIYAFFYILSIEHNTQCNVNSMMMCCWGNNDKKKEFVLLSTNGFSFTLTLVESQVAEPLDKGEATMYLHSVPSGCVNSHWHTLPEDGWTLWASLERGSLCPGLKAIRCMSTKEPLWGGLGGLCGSEILGEKPDSAAHLHVCAGLLRQSLPSKASSAAYCVSYTEERSTQSSQESLVCCS